MRRGFSLTLFAGSVFYSLVVWWLLTPNTLGYVKTYVTCYISLKKVSYWLKSPIRMIRGSSWLLWDPLTASPIVFKVVF